MRWCIGAVVAIELFGAKRADAFTALFRADDDRTTQVIEHRLAAALLESETVAWDQARWSGSPTRLAWVAPVKRGASWTITSDAWFAALDGSTQPVVFKPAEFGTAAGCTITPFRALGGCARDLAYGSGPSRVRIATSATAGPVESVTLTSGSALTMWLRANEFTVPEGTASIFDAYSADGYEFVAMRLSPKCGETSTRAFRVVTPGGATAIPTRLMTVSAGRTITTTLFALGRNRQSVGGASVATLPLRDLTWDDKHGQSNYDTLRASALSGGRSWLTEYAGDPNATAGPSPLDLYPALCGKAAVPSGAEVVDRPSTSCTAAPVLHDGGLDAGAATDADADAPSDAAVDAEAADAAPDASGEEDAGATSPAAPPESCASPDDFAVGFRTLEPRDVFLTRLRGEPSAAVLAASDLHLVSTANDPVSNALEAASFDDDKRQYPDRSSACDSAANPRLEMGPLLGAALAAFAFARRRARR